MAPLVWKSLLASAALSSGQRCTTDNCADQTTLLQSRLSSVGLLGSQDSSIEGLGSHHSRSFGTALLQSDAELQSQSDMMGFPKIASLNDPTTRKASLSQFERTVTELVNDKAHVTPIVVEVCEDTAELLRATVMSAIVNEDQTDRAMLASAYAAFGPIEEQRLAAAEAIATSGGNVQGRIQEHTQCRTEENIQCVERGHCDEECEDKTNEVELREVELELIDHEIHTEFCTHTTIVVEQMETNRVEFNRYLVALDALQEAVRQKEEACASCMQWENNHTFARTRCNTIQQYLVEAACDDVRNVVGALTAYQNAFMAAVAHYENLKVSIMIMEADRKVEWDTLERVICLLMALTNPEDGSASSEATAAVIDECHTGDVDTSHLDITYLPTPEMLGLPEPPTNPCSDEFAELAYAGEPTCAPYETLYEHGIEDVCTCEVEESNVHLHGFPHELGPFLLFDAGLSFGAGGFAMANNGQDWTATSADGVQYAGRLSAFTGVTLPALDAAFGVTGVNSIAQVAWAYPDSVGTQDMLDLHGEEYPETMQHRFIRTGGYVYLNAAGLPVALKEIAPSTDSMGQDAQLTLYFGSPQAITEAQANVACPRGLNEISLGRLLAAGAQEYCWDFSNTIDFCDHGCFLYKTVSGYIGFPVTEAPQEVTTPVAITN